MIIRCEKTKNLKTRRFAYWGPHKRRRIHLVCVSCPNVGGFVTEKGAVVRLSASCCCGKLLIADSDTVELDELYRCSPFSKLENELEPFDAIESEDWVVFKTLVIQCCTDLPPKVGLSLVCFSLPEARPGDKRITDLSCWTCNFTVWQCL